MTTNLDAFDSTIQKTIGILTEIEAKYGWEARRNQSYLALRSILHALRDRLPPNEAVHFGAQLPMLLKGVYYDGWNMSKAPQKMNREEFVNRIRQEFTFSVEGSIEDIIKDILGILSKHMDVMEMDKVKGALPDDLAALVDDALMAAKRDI